MTSYDPSTPDWQHQAFADTVFLAATHGMQLRPHDPCGLFHLMVMRIESQEFSGAKLGRWLGWAQCAVVAAGVGLTVQDMKAINSRVSADCGGGVADRDGSSSAALDDERFCPTDVSPLCACHNPFVVCAVHA